MKSKKIYEGKILNLRLDSFQMNGKKIVYEIVEHKDAVAVVPVTSDGKIILIQQYRRADDKYLWEIPAGLIEYNESKEFTAQRELQEEIGFKSNQLIHLGNFYNSPGFTDEKVYLFVGLDLEESFLALDEDEFIEKKFFSKEKVLSMIQNNEIEDSKTISGFLWYLNQKKYFL